MAQTNYVYNQLLSGTVDGVNKEFTSPQPIDRIEDLRLGGASYSDFSFSQGGTLVTLTDAPTVDTGSPYIDFFVYGANPEPVGTTVTFKDVREETYLKLGHETTSEQFPTELVDSLLNEASRVLNNQRTNPRLKLNSFSFNPTGELALASYDASEINVGTVPSNTPASGILVMPYASVIKYTGLSATSFTGLSGYSFVAQASASVNVGYALPDACKKVSSVYADGAKLEYSDIRLFTNGYKEYADQNNRYTVYRDPADGTDYLILPYGLKDDKVITVHYVTANFQYDSDADVVDFEAEYRQLLCLYAAYKACLFREDDRWQTFKQEYVEEFAKYKAYLRRTEGTSSKFVSTALRGF